MTYVSSHNIRNTRSANPSYSVRQDEVTTAANTLTLKTRQPMVKGINYFWVSVDNAMGTTYSDTGKTEYSMTMQIIW